MSLGQFGFLYLSMHLGMPPGLAALVLQAQVVFTIVIAAFALRERPSAAQVTGVGLGVLGLAVVGCGVLGILGNHGGTGARVPLTALSLLIDGPAAMAHGLAHLGWDGVLSTAYTAGLCSLVGYAVFNITPIAGNRSRPGTRTGPGRNRRVTPCGRPFHVTEPTPGSETAISPGFSGWDQPGGRRRLDAMRPD